VENLQQNQSTAGHHGEAMTLAKAAPKRRPLFQVLTKAGKDSNHEHNHASERNRNDERCNPPLPIRRSGTAAR